jgi:lysine-N-methylase
MQNITAPDYYEKFNCTGAKCEDACCSGGWNVTIDHDTYQKYQQNQQAELAPLFKSAISKNTLPSADDKNNFGIMKMKPDGACYFLQEDKLCAIHKYMGAQALSDTCRLYPRYLNQFGSQRENSLGVSCPEAARLILLNPQPMQFIIIAPDPTIDERPFASYRFPLQSEGDPQQIGVLNDFRAVIIAILQFREISLGARLMMLGFMLEDADKIVSSEKFAHASELLPILETYIGMCAHPAQLEAQFAQINSNITRKLEVVVKLIEQSLTDRTSSRFQACLQAAAEGLADVKEAAAADANMLHKYTQNYAMFYRPFFQDKEYIFENYLVNQVITRLFPFTRGSYLDLYRELVCNLSFIQVLLVGMAAKHQGLNDELVIQLFQTFARNSNHNRGHLDNLIESLRADTQDSFVHVMWMLKETEQ